MDIILGIWLTYTNESTQDQLESPSLDTRFCLCLNLVYFGTLVSVGVCMATDAMSLLPCLLLAQKRFVISCVEQKDK